MGTAPPAHPTSPSPTPETGSALAASFGPGSLLQDTGSKNAVLPTGLTSSTPLTAVLAFTFLNSLGSAVLTNGLFFLARERFGFATDKSLFALGVIWGVMYIPGALAVGPILRRLPRTGPLSTHRAFLGWLMLALGLCTILAAVSAHYSGPGRGSWIVWLMVMIYSPLSGMLWPIVESYVSGGRSGQRMRAAIGRFNITWSSSLVVSTVVMAPFIRQAPLGVLAVLGLVHLACIVSLRFFRPRPGIHGEDHEPHPPVYIGLLSFCRVALPLAFMFVAALAPYLPRASVNLKVAPEWGVALATVWLSARVCSFITLERWDGWHGRWWLPLFGLVALLAGFGALVLSPVAMPPKAALPSFIVGLAVFGIGVGVIYSAALYYAMSVGSAEVDAGGMHETLIGVGYTAGPLCGLIAVVLNQRGWMTGLSAESLMLLLTSVLAAGFSAWALRRALVLTRALRRSARSGLPSDIGTPDARSHAHDGSKSVTPGVFVHPRR
ncbi:MAG: hypothetical protein KF768_02655 [Phycisphaeraceae bacterium]|nr:hypothetical protein [Phycisphaeraceae bacterium]